MRPIDADGRFFLWPFVTCVRHMCDSGAPPDDRVRQTRDSSGARLALPSAQVLLRCSLQAAFGRSQHDVRIGGHGMRGRVSDPFRPLRAARIPNASGFAGRWLQAGSNVDVSRPASLSSSCQPQQRQVRNWGLAPHRGFTHRLADSIAQRLTSRACSG